MRRTFSCDLHAWTHIVQAHVCNCGGASRVGVPLLDRLEGEPQIQDTGASRELDIWV